MPTFTINRLNGSAPVVGYGESLVDFVSAHTTLLTYADLRMMDLRGIRLIRVDLRFANLDGANLTGADLCGACLRHASFVYTDFTDAFMRCADMRGAVWRGAIFDGADLEAASLPPSFPYAARKLTKATHIYGVSKKSPFPLNALASRPVNLP